MDKSEILENASKNDVKEDEFHEQVDIIGSYNGFNITVYVCFAIAIIKYFVFHKDPYDVLMIEFAGTTSWFGYKYKMLGYKKYKILWITYLILSILALCFFFIWELNDYATGN